MLGEERSPCGLDLGLRSGTTFGQLHTSASCHLLPTTRVISAGGGAGGEGRAGWAGGECIEWVSLHHALISILLQQSCHLSKRGKAGEEEERE